MKKILVLLGLCLFGGNAMAQISDSLGALIIDGELSTQGYQAVGQGQRALNRMRFQQDLGMLVSEIQTIYFGNYAGFSKNGLNFSGFSGIDWNVEASDDGGFYVILNGLDNASCFVCQSGTGARKVEINNGGSCQAGANKVKLLF